MIPEAEIRRSAARMNVDPMVIDLDYSLGWFLLGFIHNPEIATVMRFKGGTCLRKCYFPEYRFSEDLDFTLERHLSASQMEQTIQQIGKWVGEQGGPNFQIGPIRFEIVDDEYGSESYQARISYRGPLQWGGSPRTIRMDITRHERVLLPVVQRELQHPYSDQSIFLGAVLGCYSLEEIMAEKLRAIGGQRRFAVSRDLYDISNLLHAGVNLAQVRDILPEKFSARGIPQDRTNVSVYLSRKQEFQLDWNRRLSYLVREEDADFERAWTDVLSIIDEVL